MPSLNGYGTLTEDASGSIEDNAAETFVTAGLSKVLKINNICDSEHLEDCGITNNIVTLQGDILENFTSDYNTLVKLNSMFNSSTTIHEDYSSVNYTYSQIDTTAVAFETVNGESIVVYYNPYCVGSLNEDGSYFVQPKMCANFIYDLNGTKGPNTVGKDIGFMTSFYPSDSVLVAPYVLNHDSGLFEHSEAVSVCRSQDEESRLPNLEELSSMFVNNVLLGMDTVGAQRYWSSTVESANLAWDLIITSGHRCAHAKTMSNAVRCVKR